MCGAEGQQPPAAVLERDGTAERVSEVVHQVLHVGGHLPPRTIRGATDVAGGLRGFVTIRPLLRDRPAGNIATMLMNADAEAAPGLEPRVAAIGRELVAKMPTARRTPRAAVERRVMGAMVADPELRAAVFRFVDVRPACADPRELARHLGELLAEADDSPLARRGAALAGGPLTRRATAKAAAIGVEQMAQRFIIGAGRARRAAGGREAWRAGVATTIDLLGEATVTEEEADVLRAPLRGRRCATLHEASRRWPERPLLERDPLGRCRGSTCR